MSEMLSPDNDHQDRTPFRFDCSTAVFPPDELAALVARGRWMELLVAGTVAASCSEHEHFLAVDREEAEPATLDERAWVRLKGRREFEQQQASVPPSTPTENYGIIEWDEEKCWW